VARFWADLRLKSFQPAIKSWLKIFKLEGWGKNKSLLIKILILKNYKKYGL
jgi:hypothetical protein